MMTFAELLDPLESQLSVLERWGDPQVPILNIVDDSRHVTEGTLFVAVKGERVDGHRFLAQVVQHGAVVLVIQETPGQLQGSGQEGAARVPGIRVGDTRRALGYLAGQFHGNPSSCMDVIGITGTNGKTTVSYLCRGMLGTHGRKVGLIGTIGYEFCTTQLPASHTTPGAVELQGLFARMVERGVDVVVMEVSSHALALDRTAGSEFDVAVFTNLTQDHLDFHRTVDDYFQAKLKLFTGLSDRGRKPRTKRAIVNVDDPRGADICKTVTVPCWTYSLRKKADIRATRMSLSLEGSEFEVSTPLGRMSIHSRLVGEHNVYNVLAALGVGLHAGLSLDGIRSGLEGVTHIPGRFERVEAGQDFFVVVDYAHTADALERLLQTADALRTGRIITVFGCGGDRDRGKRPKMGWVAARYSDVLFLTSDNPRTEDPLAIIGEVEAGIRDAQGVSPRTSLQSHIIPDRRRAIEAAVKCARKGDMVLIAGKGHEDYQLIGTERYHFDDREVVRTILEAVQA